MTQRLENAPYRPWRQGTSLGFVLLALMVLALWLRSIDLELKPPHFDEGINGHFVLKMWKEGFYRYDPTNFHGPFYFYFLQLAEVLFGKGLFGYRFMTGLISVGIVAVIGMHRRFVGNAAIWAALFVAVSPGFVFYSRYAIHESLFILGQVVFTYGYFLWREERSKVAVTLMTTGFFTTFATKETFFIFFGTWLIAVACVNLSLKLLYREDEVPPPTKDESKFLEEGLPIVVIGALATITLFTGFFMRPEGLGDMFKALAVWSKTGTGGATGHEKPWHYWLDLLKTYEWSFLVALIVTPIVYFTRGRTGRLLMMTGFGSFLAYTIIAYKTPWLALNFYWMLAFTLGFALSEPPARERTRTWFEREHKWTIRGVRLAIAASLLVAFVHDVKTMWRLNFKDYVKAGEPYVYVQSTMDFRNFMFTLERHLQERPEDLNVRLAILNKDPWPMPWTLSDFPNLAWGTPETADVSLADVVTTDDSKRAIIESKLIGRYFVLPFRIRDSYEGGSAFFRESTFKNVIPPGVPVFEGKPK